MNSLVKLAARAFYDDITTKGENQPKTGRSDNRGIAVVVLDALTRRQWVREEDLAKDLKLHTKQLRRILRFFEEEKLVTRDHRKETAKGAKIYNAAVAATGDSQQTGREGDEKLKMHTHSYCCLDYSQEQLKPLIDQLARVKDLPVPEFGSLQAWELRANAAGRSTNGELNPNDPSKSSQGFGFGGTPMPYVGETKVEVAFSGIGEEGENVKPVNANKPVKVLPPWMIKEGMNLTKEQRGEANKEVKMGGTTTAPELSDDKKSTTADDEAKNIQDEYIKAYYAAFLMLPTWTRRNSPEGTGIN
ncbi:hypothetical protein DH2020_031486 [Rehmannia glutinosa]|uniref:HTH TFE/IIEalpha-type domain-containing protein n=1 Tax=Rehmannia glutinosa TaxID=99300 RepID=A0ABR0VIK3_REHGL